MTGTGDPPWRQRPALNELLADWRKRYGGRAIRRVAAGPGWISLTLAGEAPAYIFLVARPEAVLLWDATELPDRNLRSALGWTRHSPIASLLAESRLVDAGLLTEDRIVALGFESAQRGPLVLLHQLFGPRGNLVLLDRDGRLLWRLYRSPHPALTLRPQGLFAWERQDPLEEPRSGSGVRFREAALAHLTAHLTVDLLRRFAGHIRQAVRAGERLRENLRRDLAGAGREDELRRAAEALAIHLARVSRGAKEIDLPDPTGAGTVHIVLNPAISPAANLDLLFKLARKAARGRAVIAERLAKAESRLAALRGHGGKLEALVSRPDVSLEALMDWRRAAAPLFKEIPVEPAGGGRPARDFEPARPFRRFLIEQQWEVWIGRNNQENDALTHRAAAPTDFWLHAQGVTGSHVILRTGGKPEAVPKRILQKAAALAALHSKARHSSLVPVAVTQRKYVRKPRKSAPGAATCIREKTLFATPGVPAGCDPI
jgi:predicted ribosome quality control (RQC) complex YloA/Tae2 family protein